MELLKVITFTIDDSYFALPSKMVKEVVDNDEHVKGLFYGKGIIEGILSYEGNLITVIDSAFLMDIKMESKNPLILICRESRSSSAMGLTISSIRGVSFVHTSHIKATQGSEAEYIAGFIRDESVPGQKVTALLDLGKLLAYTSLKIDNAARVKG